ncbi:hypothetical protein ACIN8IBEIGE_90002 [Acinetobacter sp. 8I-beige]|nr:hypothetical protein ACIN8IBEIGE_90002 [Acinetobacter sp. 8I-beige]
MFYEEQTSNYILLKQMDVTVYFQTQYLKLKSIYSTKITQPIHSQKIFC